MRSNQILTLAAALASIAATHVFTRQLDVVGAQSQTRFVGPISSQPIALSADNALLAVANPDNNSVTLFDVKNGNNRLWDTPVGTEPNNVAISPDGTRIYAANTVSGTVSVISVDRNLNNYPTLLATIPVGTEPYGVALTPSGRKLYVTNARSNTVSVIDTTSNQVLKTIADVGFEPRGIAITNGGGDDSQETVFITQFLALPADGKTDGADDAKTGRVTILSAATDSVTGQIEVRPLAETGFNAAGDALKRIAPPATPVAADFKFPTGAYPNQLNNIAIRGKYAYIPSTGASPNGPVRFDVNTQSLLSVLDINAKSDSGRTINMHSAVAKQTATPKRFITQPWAIALKHQADEGYVLSAASNIAVKVKIDPSTGAPAVQNDPADAGKVLQIPTGKNPRGIVISSDDKTAYIMNYISRDVTVVDLSGTVEKVTATLKSSNLPAPGSAEEKVLIGKELYNTSVGEFDAPEAGKPAITGRMSNNGWGSCGACHPFGHSDNVVWIFPSGPKRTLPQHTDFDHTGSGSIRALNWSAERDEEEDFELNIRAVSGGQGLIVLTDGITQDPNVTNFTPLASGGRNQLKVRGVPAWDAIKAYIQTIRSPISPVSKTDPDVVAGRQIFTDANCQSCHGGPQWTRAKVRYNPPPDASLILNTQLIAELNDVGTFNAQAFNEVRATGAAPLGANGFAPPSLLSISAFPQTFFHNGSANSLEEVMQNVTHRSAGTGTDTLQDAGKRAQLIKFLQSIDAATQPIAPKAPGTLDLLSAASYAAIPMAPDAAVSAFGKGMASKVLGAPSTPLPTVLSGSTVSLVDSAGVMRLAQLFFVAPEQVNFLVPTNTATGSAKVTITAPSGATSEATVQVAPASPGIFAANGNGKGVAAAVAVRVASDGTQTVVPVFQCPTGGPCVTAPIPMGTSDQLFLTFFGTGLRKRTALENVTATLGGVTTSVLYAGAQPDFAGLDQINVQVPASLRGRGEIPVTFTIDGFETNPVTINVQ